jgi:hypothetical protein
MMSARDHRRLGAGAAQCRAASRPPRDRRRPRRSRLAADHQPSPGQPLARGHCRPDPGRRDAGPHRAPRSSHRAQGTILAPTSCRRRKPRCMTARASIAHGGPQRLPARAAPSLAKALHGARGPLHGLRGRSAADLTGPTMPMQPTLMSAAWSAATITPGFCRP